jgi:hypothetical protein
LLGVLIEDCIADGSAEEECAAMIKPRGTRPRSSFSGEPAEEPKIRAFLPWINTGPSQARIVVT